MDFLQEYGLFLAKTLTLLAALLIAITALARLARASKPHIGGDSLIRVERLAREKRPGLDASPPLCDRLRR